MDDIYRVKYFSSSDLSIGYELDKAATILRQFNINSSYTINDIIEFYNIKKYFDDGLYMPSWIQQEKENFIDIVKSFASIIGRYFNKLSDFDFVKLFEETDQFYKEDFWELIEKFKVYERISENVFKEILYQQKFNTSIILQQEGLVRHFSSEIRDYFIAIPVSAEILLDKYEVYHTKKAETIYIPQDLTGKDINNIMLQYINSSEKNLNYLRLIVNAQNRPPQWYIEDRIRLNAKRNIKLVEAEFFQTTKGLQYGVNISFSESQEEEERCSKENDTIVCSYSMKWITENKDFSTLLNNFIHLFHFTDLQMRTTFVNKKSKMSIFERYLFMKQQNEFPVGIQFQLYDWLSLLQMQTYYEVLLKINIRIEDIIEWFFKNYLKDEFNIENFNIKMPSKGSLYFEKCRTILPEIESALKQFKLLVENGIIEHELLQISSNHMFFKDIPSLLDKKYVYGAGEIFELLKRCFFSDQCMLLYVDRIHKKGVTYSSFYELLMNEKVNIEDYKGNNLSDIHWLINNGYLFIDSDNTIFIKNLEIILVIKDLFFNDVINYWRYPTKKRNAIDSLVNEGIVRFENTLLSIPEQNYFDYYLNKASFCNALDLRNKYDHGTQPDADSEEIHKTNYMIFLKLLIIIIIKINDEVCIKDEMEIK